MTTITHRPKGGMCKTCIHYTRKCEHLPFDSMPVIGKDKDGVMVVKCDEYKRWEREK